MNGRSKGHYLIWIKDNQFYVRIIFSKAPKNSRIHQYIHAGSQCPSLAVDRDGDRMINLFESMAISGPVLIPLDGNLASQREGIDWFPHTDKTGMYYYSRSASLKLLLDDLASWNKGDEIDILTTLSKSNLLALHKRVLILYQQKEGSIFAFSCAPIQVRLSQ
jgi:hypothetical protein